MIIMNYKKIILRDEKLIINIYIHPYNFYNIHNIYIFIIIIIFKLIKSLISVELNPIEIWTIMDNLNQ